MSSYNGKFRTKSGTLPLSVAIFQEQYLGGLRVTVKARCCQVLHVDDDGS